MKDPRSVFARPDIAHLDLRGRVPSRRFASGALHRVCVPVATIHSDETTDRIARQSLFGHAVRALPTDHPDRAFVQDIAMGYVGYMARAALGPWDEVTHRVQARRTLVYGAPDMKTPPLMALPFGALVRVRQGAGEQEAGGQDAGEQEPQGFCTTTQGHYLIARHLRPIHDPANDPVALACGFLGAPYLWGGNSPDGVDCSGLVQAALSACGLPCPGDSDQQQVMLGPPLPTGTPKQRGDLLFWRGHVAWVVDAQTILHANACHMATVFEPLDAAIARIATQGDGPVTAHIRPEVPR